MLCGFYAVGRLHLADFTALSFTQPLFVTVLAVILLGEVVHWRRWLATAVGFLGVLVMMRPGAAAFDPAALVALASVRSEEHTSELQSLMRISYAVFCLKKKKKNS